jgi:hypothetical protein
MRSTTKRSILLLISLFLVACTQQITAVQINNTVIPVELAVTPEQQARGLMFRENLTGGMLFAYQDEKPRHFWMKDTLIPLDMIFIDKENIIVTIHHAVPCYEEPCFIYESAPAQYVLEVNGNFTIENDITEGTTISFIR